MVLPITIKNNTIDLFNYIVLLTISLIIVSSSNKAAATILTAVFWFPTICNIKKEVKRGVK